VIVHVEAEFVQRSENRRLDALLAEAPRGVPEPQRAAIAPLPVAGELLGRIEIARLGLAAVVHEGVEPRTLRRAVGHIPDTALLGSEGNVGLAGHRDTFFRKLRDVRVGDEIVLTSLDGRTRYLVRETRVVEPGETWVIEPTGRASVTLVTCYPFQFIGAAPQRFVVRADRLDEPLLMARSGPAIIPISVEGAASATTNSRTVSKRAAVKSFDAGSRRAPRARAKATSRDAKREAQVKAKAPRQKRGFWKRLFSVIT
jgi:sortase A